MANENEDAARHKANLAELRAAREQVIALRKAEDAVRDESRKREDEAFEQGLKDFNEATESKATWTGGDKTVDKPADGGRRGGSDRPDEPSMPIAAPRVTPTPANVAASSSRDGFPPVTKPSVPVAEPPTPAAVAVVTPPKS